MHNRHQDEMEALRRENERLKRELETYKLRGQLEQRKGERLKRRYEESKAELEDLRALHRFTKHAYLNSLDRMNPQERNALRQLMTLASEREAGLQKQIESHTREIRLLWERGCEREAELEELNLERNHWKERYLGRLHEFEQAEDELRSTYRELFGTRRRLMRIQLKPESWKFLKVGLDKANRFLERKDEKIDELETTVALLEHRCDLLFHDRPTSLVDRARRKLGKWFSFN